MTTEREFNAATIEEAVEEAASELGMPADVISYTVADEGSAGFMGIGARDARILVTLLEESLEERQPAVPRKQRTMQTWPRRSANRRKTR